jgi:hypothetical protein
VAWVTPDNRPENVFSHSPTLPPTLRRVAVLPLSCDNQQDQLADGCATLGPILEAELAKTRKFEIIPVDPKILEYRTGRTSWTGAELLPADFLRSMRDYYGCDAVLFCQLTAFRPYSPVAVGWKMKLVDARTGETLWSVDDLFDAGQPEVLTHARRYQRAVLHDAPADLGDWLVGNAPRQFSQYTVAQVFETLPKR